MRFDSHVSELLRRGVRCFGLLDADLQPVATTPARWPFPYPWPSRFTMRHNCVVMAFGFYSGDGRLLMVDDRAFRHTGGEIAMSEGFTLTAEDAASSFDDDLAALQGDVS